MGSVNGALRGKRCLITGATGGIGAATARRSCEAGAAVVLTDLAEEGVRELAESLAAEGFSAHALALDVSDDEAVAAVTAEAARLLGGLDTLVANAGILTTGSIYELTPELFQRTLDVNLTGTFHCIRHAAPHLRDAGNSSIVASASQAGIEGVPGASSYAASKFGVVGLVQSMARELAGEGIRANAVAPGLVDTPMLNGHFERQAELRGVEPAAVAAELLAQVPIGRLATAEEVADAIVYLASDQASYVSGVTLPVLGGQISK